MGCFESRDAMDGRERSRAIDAMLKPRSWRQEQTGPLRVLVLDDPRSGWNDLVMRIAETHGLAAVDPACRLALALTCVARFGFGCPKDVARLLYRAALRTCERGLQELNFPASACRGRGIELMRYGSFRQQNGEAQVDVNV
jgi:hypothetical protein